MFNDESLIKTAEYLKINIGYNGDLSPIKFFRNFIMTEDGQKIVLEFRKILGELIAKKELKNNALDVLKKVLELIQKDPIKSMITTIRSKNEEIEQAKKKAEQEQKDKEEAEKKAKEAEELKKKQELESRQLKMSFDLTNIDCPSGYKKYENKYCFHLSAYRRTRPDYEFKYCHSKGGFMVDRNRVYAALNIATKQSNYVYYMFVGMNDLNLERGRSFDKWQMTDGSYTSTVRENWQYVPDNSGNNEHCVLAFRNGKTSDVPCWFTTNHYTVCEWNPVRGKANNDIGKWKSVGKDNTRGWVSMRYGENYWTKKATDVATPKDCLEKATAGNKYCISFYHSVVERSCYYNLILDGLIPMTVPTTNDYEKWIPESIYLHNFPVK